jgi:hypothetical protein
MKVGPSRQTRGSNPPNGISHTHCLAGYDQRLFEMPVYRGQLSPMVKDDCFAISDEIDYGQYGSVSDCKGRST